MTDFPTLLIYIPLVVKSLPFYIPEAWKRYPFRAEPPRVGHYREYPPGNKIYFHSIVWGSQTLKTETAQYGLDITFKEAQNGLKTLAYIFQFRCL